MKLTFLDAGLLGFSDEVMERYARQIDIVVYDRIEKELVDKSSVIIERIGDSNAIATSSLNITREIMMACPQLKFISTQSAGFDNIDLDAAKAFDILVSNVPDYGTQVVSQMAIALMLEACNNVGKHSHSVRQNNWKLSKDWCFWEEEIIEINNKTAGIIGYGNIGKRTAKILNAFGMRVLATTVNPNEKSTEEIEIVDYERLYAQSDFIFLHCPHTKQTEYIINSKSIEKMKDGVILINNSRGKLVNNEDLYQALKTRKIRVAACDVLDGEPIGADHKLLGLENFILTPHISWASVEVRHRIVACVLENVDNYRKGTPINIVSK